jgi:hypothetical protein
LVDDNTSKLRYNWALRANEFKNVSSAYTVKLERIFASSRSDYSPMYVSSEGNELYFTSTRNLATSEDISGITGMKNGDIFCVRKDEKGRWKAPILVEGGLNTVYDEGACCFSADGKMYLTVCPTDPTHPRMAEIWTSNRSDAKWSKATKLKITEDTLSSYAHPCVSPDGNWLYFVSDMPGGFGGTDLRGGDRYMNLFVIGNWFDIHHNLPTRYRDFREYLIEKYPGCEDFDDLICVSCPQQGV